LDAKIGILNEQHSTLQLKRLPHENAIHSTQVLHGCSAPASISDVAHRPHLGLAIRQRNTPAATMKRTTRELL
jgi:hypothetical protein